MCCLLDQCILRPHAPTMQPLAVSIRIGHTYLQKELLIVRLLLHLKLSHSCCIICLHDVWHMLQDFPQP